MNGFAFFLYAFAVKWVLWMNTAGIPAGKKKPQARGARLFSRDTDRLAV